MSADKLENAVEALLEALVIPNDLTADEQAQIADIAATARRQIEEIVEASSTIWAHRPTVRSGAQQ